MNREKGSIAPKAEAYNIWQVKPWAALALLVLACIGFSYFQIIRGLVHQWGASEDYSHGFLILPISAYLIWERRAQFKDVPVIADWRALPFLVLSGIVFIVGELGAELFTTRVSMILLTIVSVWFLFGVRILREIRFPLLFLFLMLPLPGLVYRNLTFPLQLISSELAVELLRLFGVSAFREGNVIDLGVTQLQVVEACNGLRFILPLLTVGVLLSFYDRKSIWERAILILSTIPIAILANIIRISGTGFMTGLWGPKAAEGFLHAFSGWAVFMFCIGCLVGLGWVLHRITGKKSVIPSGKGWEKASGAAQPPFSYAAFLTAATVILLVPVAVHYFGVVPPVALKKSLTLFPHQIDHWSGTPGEMTPEMWERVGGQEYVIINYTRENSAPINFYAAYYAYQRKGGDFIHSPKGCLPGAGWFIEQQAVRELNGTGAIGDIPIPLKFNELVTLKESSRQLVYYWYQGRHRNFTSEWAAKFYMVWDGIFRRRTDGALVRVIMPMAESESLQSARQVLDPFAVQVSGLLKHHLP